MDLPLLIPKCLYRAVFFPLILSISFSGIYESEVAASRVLLDEFHPTHVKDGPSSLT